LRPPQKLQRPDIFPACVACPCADADNFSSSQDRNVLFRELSCEKKKMLASIANVYFFSLQKSLLKKSFVSG
jgi:hypothetical protein